MVAKKITLLLLMAFWVMEPFTGSFVFSKPGQSICAVCGAKTPCGAACCGSPRASGLSRQLDSKTCLTDCASTHSHSIFSQGQVKWFALVSTILPPTFKPEIRVSHYCMPNSIVLPIPKPPPRLNDLC
jgi:hypothetical protein